MPYTLFMNHLAFINCGIFLNLKANIIMYPFKLNVIKYGLNIQIIVLNRNSIFVVSEKKQIMKKYK